MARLTRLALVLACLLLPAACRREPPPPQYPLHGQILAVDTERNQLVIKHDDIPNYMPGMTMAFPVSSPSLMQGRAVGEIVDATLEVDKMLARIIAVTHVGEGPITQSTSERAMLEGILDVGGAVPDAALMDQADKRRSLSEWHGTPSIITFTYTRCPLPNFCPLMDQNFATLQRRLADDTVLRGRLKLITVTFDPEHDTPAVLAAHAAKLKADPAVWTFLTGDTTTVERLAGSFGIGVLRDPKEPVQVTHNLRTFLVGADGRIVKVYSGNDWTPGDALTDLRGLVAPAK